MGRKQVIFKLGRGLREDNRDRPQRDGGKMRMLGQKGQVQSDGFEEEKGWGHSRET